MDDSEIRALAQRIETETLLDAGLRSQVSGLLGEMVPGVDGTTEAIDTVEGALTVVDAAVPGGHWNCHLRHPDFRDSDEIIGAGRSPLLPHALLAAVLRVFAYRRRD